MKNIFAIILFLITGYYGIANSGHPTIKVKNASLTDAQVIIDHMAYSPASLTVAKGTGQAGHHASYREQRYKRVIRQR